MNKSVPSLRFFLTAMLLASSPSLLCAQGSGGEGNETKLDQIIKETQLSVGGKDTTGFVWWLPTEFWEQSAIEQGSKLEQARSSFAPLREYTMVIVAVGKIGLGNINWRSENDVRSGVVLRDSEGQTYQPVKEISGDAQGIAVIIKPVLANILGPMGQNLHILFFPGRTSKGVPIADPTRPGGFSVLLTNLTAQKETEFSWRLPLTSLSAARFCPVGKERVEANWKFCPWHGNKLEESAVALSKAAVTTEKKAPQE